MATIALQTYLQKKQKKEAILDKFLNAYREYSADIICGLLSLNGSANVCSIYRALKNRVYSMDNHKTKKKES